MAREIRITKDEKSLTVLIPKIGPWTVLALTGFWCAVWVLIFYNLNSGGVLAQHPDMTVSMIGFGILWLFIFRIFLWNAIGHERILCDHQHLLIKRAGTFLTFSRKYELDLIDEFRYSETSSVPRLSAVYGFAGGKICFDYWERPEYFGQSVTKAEAEEIVVLFNEWLKRNKPIEATD